MLFLVTAVSSPVGCKVASDLLHAGHQVIGTVPSGWQDTRHANFSRLLQHPCFVLTEIDFCSRAQVMRLFEQYQPDAVLHLGGRNGLYLLDQSGQHCVDSTQQMMLNLLDASVRWQCGHFVYCQAVTLYEECPEGRYRHQALLKQVEAKMQLLAHTHSLIHRLCTSGVCFHAAVQHGNQPNETPHRYYGRDVHALAHQLLEVLLMAPVLLKHVNPYFVLYQAASMSKPVSRWPVRKILSYDNVANSHKKQALSAEQQKFSQ